MIDIGIATKALCAIMGIYQKSWIISGATITGLKEQNLKKIELTNSWEYENKQISNFVLHRIMKGWKLQMLRIQNITDLLMTQPDKYKAEIMLKMHKRTIIYTHSKTTKLSLVSTQSTTSLETLNKVLLLYLCYSSGIK